MGKVMDVIEDMTHKVIDKVFDDVLGLESIAEGINSVDKLLFSVVNAPCDLVSDTLRGESFKKSLASSLSDIATSTQSVYSEVFDDWLGLDDRSWLGSQFKDFMYDHAQETIAVGAMIAVLVVAWYLGPIAAEFAKSIAITVIQAGLSAGILTAGSALIIPAYFALYGLVYAGFSLGISALTTAFIGGGLALLLMPKFLNTAVNKLVKIEKLNESIRTQNFNDVADGSIFEKLAGGFMYNNVYAGGSLYAYDQQNSLDMSVGGMFNNSNGSSLINFIGEDQAGSGIFENQFNLNIIDTTVNGSGRSTMSAQQASYLGKRAKFNRAVGNYNDTREEYNSAVDEYKKIADGYNALPNSQKTKERYDKTVADLKALENKLGGMTDELTKKANMLENAWNKPWEQKKTSAGKK